MHMNGMSIMLQVNDRLQDYAERVKNGLLSVDSREFEKVYETLKWAYLNQAEVMVCGNGGSLTMSEHFHCDHDADCRSNRREGVRLAGHSLGRQNSLNHADALCLGRPGEFHPRWYHRHHVGNGSG